MALASTGFSQVATVSGSTPSATLPAGITTGDFGGFVVHINQTSGVSLSGFTDWTVQAGPVQAGGNNCISWVLTKVLTSAESSTVISGTFSASGFWAIAGEVVTGGSLDQVSAVLSQATLVTADNYASFTPVSANCMAVQLMGKSYSAGNGGGTATAASGWTESGDVASTAAASVQVGAYAAHKQLSGQAGVLQTSVAGTGTVTHRANSWVVTVAPAVAVSATAALSGVGTLTSVNSAGFTAVAAMSGAGTLAAAAGAPAMTDVAVLSGGGTLSASGVPAITGEGAAFTGGGTLTGTVTAAGVVGVASLSGVGSLSAFGTTSGADAVASANLSGVGTLEAVAWHAPPAREWRVSRARRRRRRR